MKYYLIINQIIKDSKKRHGRPIVDDYDLPLYVSDSVKTLNDKGIINMILLSRNEEEAELYYSLIEAQDAAKELKRYIATTYGFEVDITIAEYTRSVKEGAYDEKE